MSVYRPAQISDCLSGAYRSRSRVRCLPWRSDDDAYRSTLEHSVLLYDADARIQLYGEWVLSPRLHKALRVESRLGLLANNQITQQTIVYNWQGNH